MLNDKRFNLHLFLLGLCQKVEGFLSMKATFLSTQQVGNFETRKKCRTFTNELSAWFEYFKKIG